MRKSVCAWAVGVGVLGIGALGAAPASLAAATTPWVADVDASPFLEYSAWSYENQVDLADCHGLGPAHRFGGNTGHSRFRCTVDSGGDKATIEATALGPEWLRVTKVAGGLAPDRGIGAIPSGRQVMDDDQAANALESSSWAAKHEVDDAFCSGIGSYHGTLATTGYIFGAFDCATLSGGRQEPQVILRVTGRSSVQIARTISR